MKDQAIQAFDSKKLESDLDDLFENLFAAKLKQNKEETVEQFNISRNDQTEEIKVLLRPLGDINDCVEEIPNELAKLGRDFSNQTKKSQNYIIEQTKNEINTISTQLSEKITITSNAILGKQSELFLNQELMIDAQQENSRSVDEGFETICTKLNDNADAINNLRDTAVNEISKMMSLLQNENKDNTASIMELIEKFQGVLVQEHNLARQRIISLQDNIVHSAQDSLSAIRDNHNQVLDRLNKSIYDNQENITLLKDEITKLYTEKSDQIQKYFFESASDFDHRLASISQELSASISLLENKLNQLSSSWKAGQQETRIESENSLSQVSQTVEQLSTNIKSYKDSNNKKFEVVNLKIQSLDGELTESQNNLTLRLDSITGYGKIILVVNIVSLLVILTIAYISLVK